jgi:putative membrane protein
MTDDPAPYADDQPCELILRDHLAIDRTILANERTFLAYTRTALTLLVVGASLIKFSDSLTLEIIGWVSVPFAIGTFIFGVTRYRRMLGLIRAAESGTREEGGGE